MKKKPFYFLAGIIAAVTMFLSAPVTTSHAAEYTVTEATAILYTNEYTQIFKDADLGTLFLPTVDADLPIQATGVTSNGFFRIDLAGETYYIPGIGLSAKDSTTTSTSTTTKTSTATSAQQAEYQRVHDAMVSLEASYPEGLPWTNDNYYDWNGGVFSRGYGCAGFAFILSDYAFGNAKARVHTDYSNIRVGDILRINNDTHTVIVLEVKDDSVIVAEGNYNSSVHWGRELSMSDIQDSTSYIMTRYQD